MSPDEMNADNLNAKDDLLVARLLPAVVHDVNNCTQLLVGLRALLAVPGGETMFAAKSTDLAKAGERMGDLGFAMAALATAAGANMLMARRDPRSIRILWELALHAIQRDLTGTVAVEGEPPLTASQALDGWQVAWSAASVLMLASDTSDALGWSWCWRSDGSLEGSGPADALVSDGDLVPIRERVPGLVLEAHAERIRWIPRDEWLIPRDR